MKSSKDITLQINPLFVGIQPILSPKDKKYFIKILILYIFYNKYNSPSLSININQNDHFFPSDFFEPISSPTNSKQNNIKFTNKSKSTYVNLQKEIIKAFKEGFNKVFDINLLKSFSSKEIEFFICGSENSESNTNDDIWSYENLTSNIIPMHGYNKNSLIYKGLIEILQKMSKTERKMGYK